MRILIAHNYYQQPGGEDVVFEAEARLLESRGQEVTRFTARNHQINGMSRLALARNTIRNHDTAGNIARIVREKGIQIAHFHNTFPLISPAALHAARSAGAAVVQTIHNHRLVCANGLLFRDGHICHDCVGRSFGWPAIVHACYRGSRAATTVVSLMQLSQRSTGTYQDHVDAYIAPSESLVSRIGSAGLPFDRITVKPHFVEGDPQSGDGAGGYALFLGRLSPEKGLHTLLRTWALLKQPRRLIIVGDGPLADLVRNPPPNVEWLGRQPLDIAHNILSKAAMLIFPSECYETFGRTIAESFAMGTPVIAANLASPGDMVEPSRTGALFAPGDAVELAAKIDELNSDPSRLARMRLAARRAYESKYHESVNYDQLISIYERALAFRNRKDPPGDHHDQLG